MTAASLLMRLRWTLAWMGLLLMCWPVAAGDDPRGDCLEPKRDLINLSAQQDGPLLIVAVKLAAPGGADRLQLFIDADANAATGFAPASRPDCGFELLIQGEQLHRFHGSDRSAWNWQSAGNVKQTIDGTAVNWEIDTTLLPGGAVGLTAATLSDDWQQTLDYAPDREPLAVKLNADAQPTEKSGDCDDAGLDLIAFTPSEAAGKLTFTLQTRGPGSYDQLLIFLDTDENPATGYAAPARPGGYEMLIQGDALYRHDPDAARDAWAWLRVGDVARAQEGATLKLTFDASLLKTAATRVVVLMMSPDWQQVRDAAPDHGSYRVKVNAQAAAAAPPVPFAQPRANRTASARQRVRDAQSYYCYYGPGQTEALSHYDLVILEARQQKRPALDALKQLGVVTTAYITFGEDHHMQRGDGAGPGGYASWYFDRDGDQLPDRNSVWNSYYTNAGNAGWRATRLEEARRLVQDEGYDGVFLDTLDTVGLYPDSYPGMVQLLTELRQSLPEAVIIMNQGLPLLPKVAAYVDAVMIESFSLSYDFDTRSYFRLGPAALDHSHHRIRQGLLPYMQETGLRGLVLDYAGRDATHWQMGADRAATFGMLFAVAPIQLDQVYPAPPTGHVDARWKQRQATPENLSVTLTEERNGFPAGTRLLPSSCFGGYSVEPVVDGVADRASLHWSKNAWASAELDEAHHLEIRLPTPRQGGTLQIDWALDNGQYFPSRQFAIEVRQGDDWRTVRTFADHTQNVTECPLPAEPYSAIRITQPIGGGSAARAELMWIAQVKLR